MERFSVYTFSAKEISQICTLVRAWSDGRILPIDKRTCSKQVLAYAERWNLLERKEDGRLYCGRASAFHLCYDLPSAALWQLVASMVPETGSIGVSLARNPGWLVLNIYPQEHRYATAETLGEQIDILICLQQAGYIWFQMGGSVWNIVRAEKNVG